MQEIITYILGSFTLLGALAWLLKIWVASSIKSIISHEFDKRKIDYKNQIEIRTRAKLIAELLAEWLSSPIDSSPMLPEQRKRLNQLSFEASLWLPEEIALQLSLVLQKSPNAPNAFNLLLKVREYLSGKHNLTLDNITQWTREHEIPNKGLPEE